LKLNLTSIALLSVVMVLLSASLCAAGISLRNSGSYSNDTAVSTFEYFEEGRELYKKHDLEDAEKKLMRARAQVSQDDPQFSFFRVENILIPGGGRWPKYKQVDVTRTEDYYPNRLLKELRLLAPPKPVVVMEVIEGTASGFDVFANVKNDGTSRIEQIAVSFQGRSNSGEKSIQELLPGQSKRIHVTTVKSLEEAFSGRVAVSEMYGFEPCEIQF